MPALADGAPALVPCAHGPGCSKADGSSNGSQRRTPKGAAIEHLSGRRLGMPGGLEGLRAVVEGTSDVAKAAVAGHLEHLPFRWPEPVGVARKQGAHEPPPIAKLVQCRSWLLHELAAGKSRSDG